jgi:hypothetical protein
VTNDERGELDWSQMSDEEWYAECHSRINQVMQAFMGQPITEKTAESIVRTVMRERAIILLEINGLRRSVAEAVADCN